MDQALASLSKLSQQPLYLITVVAQPMADTSVIFGVFSGISQQLEPGVLALQSPQNHTARQHSYLLVFRKPTPQIPSIHTQHMLSHMPFYYCHSTVVRKAQFHVQKYPLQLLSLIPMSCCFDACICVHVLI